MFSPDTFTTGAIDAYLRISPNLTRLDGYPDHKVVLLQSSHWKKQQRVALISGGGDGHAPDSMAFIGQGMLTAAVSGHLFASPSTESIHAAIQSLYDTDNDHKNEMSRDVLLIIKNYTGDRLNFGLALELSKTMRSNNNVELVVVGDDVSLPRHRSIAGRRGIAGTILVIKIAGAAAAEGQELQTVTQIAQSAAKRLVSLSAVMRSCHLPGESRDANADAVNGVDDSSIALGWGIHNEQGSHRIKREDIQTLIHRMIDIILTQDKDRDFFWREAVEQDDSGSSSSSSPVNVVLLVNNLGSMIDNEMHIITGHALDDLHERGMTVIRVLCAKFMTGLDQRGFSLTLLRLPSDPDQREKMIHYLDADTTAPAWPNAPLKAPPALRPILTPMNESTFSSPLSSIISSSPLTHAILIRVAESLIAAADELNFLDSAAGDGDCGNTFKVGALALLKDIKSFSASGSGTSTTFELSSLFDALRRYTAAMGGTSGALYSILFTAAARQVVESDKSINRHQNASLVTTARRVADALTAGVTVLQKYSGAQLNDRTMLDALSPALHTFVSELSNDATDDAIVSHALQAALTSAQSGLSATQHMTARAGRASYVPSSVSSQGVDPGAKAIVVMLTAVLDAMPKP